MSTRLRASAPMFTSATTSTLMYPQSYQQELLDKHNTKHTAATAGHNMPEVASKQHTPLRSPHITSTATTTPQRTPLRDTTATFVPNLPSPPVPSQTTWLTTSESGCPPPPQAGRSEWDGQTTPTTWPLKKLETAQANKLPLPKKTNQEPVPIRDLLKEVLQKSAAQLGSPTCCVSFRTLLRAAGDGRLSVVECLVSLDLHAAWPNLAPHAKETCGLEWMRGALQAVVCQSPAAQLQPQTEAGKPRPATVWLKALDLEPGAAEKYCWNYVCKNFCPRGPTCRWGHPEPTMFQVVLAVPPSQTPKTPLTPPKPAAWTPGFSATPQAPQQQMSVQSTPEVLPECDELKDAGEVLVKLLVKQRNDSRVVQKADGGDADDSDDCASTATPPNESDEQTDASESEAMGFTPPAASPAAKSIRPMNRLGQAWTLSNDGESFFGIPIWSPPTAQKQLEVLKKTGFYNKGEGMQREEVVTAKPALTPPPPPTICPRPVLPAAVAKTTSEEKSFHTPIAKKKDLDPTKKRWADLSDDSDEEEEDPWASLEFFSPKAVAARKSAAANAA